MADVIAQLFVDKLTSLLQEEANLLGGVRQDAEYMRDELQRMTAFLRDVDARQLTEGNDSQLKVWVNQVRVVAYDIEDVLDEFILRLQHHHNVQGFYGSLRRIGCFVKKLKARHRIASQIRSLKVRVRDIAEGNQRYRLEGKSLQQSSSSNIAATRILNAVQGEADLVGIENPKQQLVEWLLKPDSKLQCISVVGMGGSGKTTLVKKVYDDPSVKNHFHSHLWVVVSQSLNLVELLREIVRQLLKKIGQPLPQGVESMSVNELKEIIDNILQQRRFLLVIDDVWSISDSEDVRNIVPVNDCGSRLMLTTRKIDVASQGEYTLNLKPLSQEESWTLFCKKAFPRSFLCPPPLKEISQRILSRCEGLPLAIVVIAGVLATKDESRVEEWERFEQSLPTGSLERVKKLLFLSYYDLSYHLKICFLYMSLFPEDEEINTSRLIRLWIAEGFVQTRPRMSFEDVAEEYLKELINRSLVQVGDIASLTGRLKTCRLHDLLREMILSIATEHKFIMVASGSSYEWPEIVRRLAIHEDDDNWQVSSKYFTRLRSFLLFSHDHFTFMSKLHQSIFVSSKFLKVLDFRKARLDEIPPEIFRLVHLRYLSLRGTNVVTIPKLIGNLEKLETLDLKLTEVACVPKEIVRLVRLRHLLVGKRLWGVKVPSNIGALSSLQKLSRVDVSKNGEEVLREIGRLSELRKLGIFGLRREHGMTLCSFLSKLTNLRSLDLSYFLYPFTQHPFIISSPTLSSCGGGELNVNYSLPTLPFLERIRLQGPIDKALNCKSFPNLITLKLIACTFVDTDSLYFKAGGFQRLTHLIIWRFDGLKMVTIEEGAMPHLDTLFIWNCKLLDVLPFGIEHLTKLRRLQLHNMPSNVTDGCKDKEHRDYWRIAHIPQVEID